MSSGIALMKALEPYNPCFYEQIVQPLNVEIMAELARRTGAGRG
jgi:L-alanine-DL-glutamate epimerase-like enolase superfamily enzyme